MWLAPSRGRRAYLAFSQAMQRDIMQAISASALVGYGHDLMVHAAPARVFTTFRRNMDVNAPLDEPLFDAFVETLRNLQDDCLALGLTMTLAQVNRVLTWIESLRANRLSVTFSEAEANSRDISSRPIDELASGLFLSIDAKEVPYYQTYASGWEDAIKQFPSISTDVEEASKCFALNRYTAVVFHLMRVMETGLRLLADTLHDSRLNPKTNPTWEHILRRCREELSKPLAQRSAEWQSDEAFFSGVSARLMAVKDAWRNPTMHVESAYTEQAALDVFNHVQAFMRHLATKLHEEGL